MNIDWKARDAAEFPKVEGGHAWKREEDGLVDVWQYDADGRCLGPGCARCGASFCRSCWPKRLLELCPEFGTELPGLELT